MNPRELCNYGVLIRNLLWFISFWLIKDVIKKMIKQIMKEATHDCKKKPNRRKNDSLERNFAGHTVPNTQTHMHTHAHEEQKHGILKSAIVWSSINFFFYWLIGRAVHVLCKFVVNNFDQNAVKWRKTWLKLDGRRDGDVGGETGGKKRTCVANAGVWGIQQWNLHKKDKNKMKIDWRWSASKEEKTNSLWKSTETVCVVKLKLRERTFTH